ncbi:general substrate transporter [Astrocystis sublimbata]|nr:general substrate transporter [Astrocystis sublimbata]
MSSHSSFMGLRGGALRAAMIALIVGPAFTVFGYNQSGLGPLASLRSFVSVFPQLNTLDVEGAELDTNSIRKGAVIASYQIGGLLGALSCLNVGDRLGRRKTIFMAAILTIIGEVLQTASYDLIQFVIGRVILGFGVGQFSVAIPVWLAECSSASHRGRDVITTGLFMCLGYALSNWIDFAFYFIKNSSLQWRLPLAVSNVPSLVVTGAIFFLPESPRWLASVGQYEQATTNLAALRNLSETDHALRTEMAQIESAIESSADQKKASLMEMFSKDDQEKLLYRFGLCFALQFFQQACGGGLISIYASTIFEENLGLGTINSKVLAAAALTWKFLCCFLAFWAIDRLGRRTVFMISGTGMSLCMVSLAVSSSFGSENYSSSIVSALFLFLFNIFYPLGFLGGNFLYCTEVAPVRLRVAMNSISTANHWLWNFVIALVTPIALNTIGYRYYIIYAVTSALIPIGVYFLYPETMNRNLELLNSVFRDASSPREIVAMARRLPQGELADDDSQSDSAKVKFDEKEMA